MVLTGTMQLVSNSGCYIEATNDFKYCFGSASGDEFSFEIDDENKGAFEYSGIYGAMYAKNSGLKTCALAVAVAV